ncbi:GTPase HflX, partial [Paenibacillus sepulcri]|nr:GTPase HflX [Paenibacillus sepulcri]
MKRYEQEAVIIGIHLQNQPDFAAAMEELGSLAAACGIEVVGELSQKAARPSPSHYMGKGKLEELSALLAGHENAI